MTRSRLHLLLVALAVTAGLTGCGGKAYLYEPVDSGRLLSAAEHQSDGPIRVAATVPGRQDVEKIFGIDLYDQGIQPVWLRIENTGDVLARYAPVSTDSQYFSPLEVAYMNRRGYSDESREAMDERFHSLVMPRYVPAGETRSGFVFTHADPGAKAFNVDVFARDDSHNFTFLLGVPGFEPDYARLDLGEMYAGDDTPGLDEDALRQAIRNLPCCSADRTGERSAEPINVVLVGDGEDLLRALLRSGWRETSIQQAKVRTPQFYFGREQDAIFRYDTVSGDSFYEMRFWKAPFSFDGSDVYAGQARHFYRRIGTVTVLDADVDNARSFAAQKFLYGQAINSYAWIASTEVVPVKSFWSNLFRTAYFTDGHRIVMWLSADPTSMFDTDIRSWDPPPMWMQP